MYLSLCLSRVDALARVIMAPKSDIRLDGDEVEILCKRTRLVHRGETKVDLHPEGGNLTLGGHGSEGDVILKDGQTDTRIHMDASSGVPVGGDKLRVFVDGKRAKLRLGGDRRAGRVSVADGDGTETIRLDGDETEVVVDGRPLLETIERLESRIEQLENQLTA